MSERNSKNRLKDDIPAAGTCGCRAGGRRGGKERCKSDYEEIKERYRKQLLAETDLAREWTDEQIKERIGEKLDAQGRREGLTIADRKRMGKELFSALRGLDILQELLEDNSITEIMINGTEGIYIERAGSLFRWPRKFSSEEKLQDIVQRIVAGCNRMVNEASPVADARLPGGARVNVVLPPVALNGPVVTIRRFPDKPVTMGQLIAMNTLSGEAAGFLRGLVRAGYNILISGGTGSGKTTFLNALTEYIPPDERIITIEDNAELQLLGIENLVRLEARNANSAGCSAVTIRDLIKTSLRMRPHRIIVGEVRSGEAIDMLQAMNCGHDGSMSTAHANSAEDLLLRLETMVLMGMELPLEAVRRQIATGVDIIVHLGRLRDKSRRVLEIAELTGMEDGKIRMHSLYRFEEQSKIKDGKVLGRLMRKEELLETEKLQRAGVSLP